MSANELSENALKLLRLHFAGNSLTMGSSNPEPLPGLTVEQTRAAYGELVAAGLMILIDISKDGQKSRHWLTLAAVERRAEWVSPAQSSPPASLDETAAPAG